MSSKQRPYNGSPHANGPSPRHKVGSKISEKEERDAANLAKRKKDTAEECEEPKKLLKLIRWHQTKTEVTITLLAGKKLSSNDIDVDFMDSAVKVSLTDGRKWNCIFNGGIIKTSSRLQLQKMRIILKVIKKVEGLWPSLERTSQTASTVTFSTALPTQKLQTSKSSTFSNGDKIIGSCNGSSTQNSLQSLSRNNTNDKKGSSTSVSLDTGIVINQVLAEEKKDNLIKERDILGKNADEKSEVQPVDPKMGSENKSHFPLDSSSATDLTDGKPMESLVKDEDDIYDLNHIKYDFYEPNPGSITVAIYVKNIIKDTVKVDIQPQEINVLFRTTDKKFLGMYEGKSEDTKFRWHVEVVKELNVGLSKYKVKPQSIELALHKMVAFKWGALEASQSKEAMTPQSDSWVSTNQKSRLNDISSSEISPPKNTDVSDQKKSKVIFDELEGSRSSRDKTADWLDRQLPSLSSTDYNKSSQKPTCLVSPLGMGSSVGGTVVTPGFTGLDNLGNTCFMNSSLQVLANTTQLRDYFTDGSFQCEINQENVLGTGGKLAVMFATLMKVLWKGSHRSYAPSKLKSLVASKWNQFMGYAQHDAQEFMAFLLDGLHEDVNRVRDKPYTEQVDSAGRPDEVVANEAWERHKKRNDSFIVDLFQGQYKSKLVCPVCSKVSITFDPFMIMPVPLPKKQRLLPVTFFSQDVRKMPVKYMLRLPHDATVEQLKDQMFVNTRVHPKQLRVFEVFKSRVHMFFGKGESLKNVQSNDKIFVCEVISPEVAGESVLELCILQRTEVPTSTPMRCSCCHRDVQPGTKLKRCSKCFRTAYCDRACQSEDWTRHKPNCTASPELIGQPFIVSIPESKATYSQLCHLLEARARFSINLFLPPAGDIESSRDSTPPVQPDSCAALTNSASSSPLVSDEASDSPLGAVAASSGVQDKLNLASPSSTVTSGNYKTKMSGYDTVDPQIQRIVSDPKVEDSLSQTDSGFDSMSVSSVTSMIQLGGETGSCMDEGGSDTSSGQWTRPPTGYVVGWTQEQPADAPRLFSLRACDKDGRNLQGVPSQKLANLGDEALDLKNIYFLAMDWKNKEKSTPCVLVEAKSLDCKDDESVDKLSSDESGPITLEQCLSLFTEPDLLTPDNTWYCPKCKEHREATKQMSLWRLPQTLIIQLKRFSFRNLLWRDKIDKMVQFPIRNLDLSSYYVGTRPSDEPPPIYDLYGVINHHGGILGGHYTAYARCPDLNDPNKSEVDWRLFDDSVVSTSSESQVTTRAAYVLFYRRRQILTDPQPYLATPTASSHPDLDSDLSEDEFCDASDACPSDAQFDVVGRTDAASDDGIGPEDIEFDDLGGPPLIDEDRFAGDASDSDVDNPGSDVEHKMADLDRHLDEMTDEELATSFTDMDAVD